jgi:hypothetical protein
VGGSGKIGKAVSIADCGMQIAEWKDDSDFGFWNLDFGLNTIALEAWKLGSSKARKAGGRKLVVNSYPTIVIRQW